MKKLTVAILSGRSSTAMDPRDARRLREYFENVARHIVALGFDDGVDMANPRTARRLLETIEGLGHRRPPSWRIMHTKKLRQIYGAAFDCSAMARKLVK